MPALNLLDVATIGAPAVGSFISGAAEPLEGYSPLESATYPAAAALLGSGLSYPAMLALLGKHSHGGQLAGMGSAATGFLVSLLARKYMRDRAAQETKQAGAIGDAINRFTPYFDNVVAPRLITTGEVMAPAASAGLLGYMEPVDGVNENVSMIFPATAALGGSLGAYTTISNLAESLKTPRLGKLAPYLAIATGLGSGYFARNLLKNKGESVKEANAKILANLVRGKISQPSVGRLGKALSKYPELANKVVYPPAKGVVGEAGVIAPRVDLPISAMDNSTLASLDKDSLHYAIKQLRGLIDPSGVAPGRTAEFNALIRKMKGQYNSAALG